MTHLPPDLRAHFDRCVAAPVPPAAELPQLVRDHLAEMQRAARQSETLPVDLAEDISRGLLTLLADAAGLSPDELALVHGAARYFIASDDARPDLEGPLGLDDDATVFNYVVAQIGRSDLEVEL